MSIIKHVTLQKIVAHDFRYVPRIIRRYNYNYKMFKNAPTCFGSQRIHHQGALYSVILAKYCIRLPEDGSSVIRNVLEHF